jgi:uncharacterized repeat protein (TIGR01451 family)
MKTRCLLTSLILGLGLALALLWLMANGPTPVTAAPGCRSLQPPGGVITVCPSGCDYSAIQDAVDAADDGDVIKVAAATYTDLHPAVVDWRTITQVVYIRKSVAVQGGYTTTNWRVPDPVANPTVLDARGRGRVLYISGAISPAIEGLCITGGDAAGLGGGPLGEDTGGGVYVAANMVAISKCQVFSNTADQGGGVYLNYGVATLDGNTVTSNTAGYGGGLFLSGSAVTLSGNAVTSNTADYGGGLFLSHGAATLNGNTVVSNAASFFGGGMLLLHSDGTALNGNIVVSNAAGYGGGLYLDQSAATLTNNVVADNQAHTAGSGLYILASSPRLLHTTVARNRGGDGSGLHVTDGGPRRSSVALTNTILVGHTAGITIAAGNTATLEATLWGADAWANGTDWSGPGAVITGTLAGNYWDDPGFVDPCAGDYHVGLASAALNTGVDAGVRDDLDGDPRPQGSGYDLGADETGLVVTKRAVPSVVRPGAQLNYAICVTNTSVTTLTAAITDVLPDHVTSAGVLTWMPVTIAPGDVWIQTVTVTPETDYVGVLTNAVQVTTGEGPDGAYTETSVAGCGVYMPLVLRGR